MPKPLLDSTILIGAVSRLGAELLHNAFEPCKIQGCTGHSPSIVCTECSRTICLSHAFLTISARPERICVSCVMERHRELWDEDEFPPEQRRAGFRVVSDPPGDDEGTVDAEYEEVR